MTLLHSFFGAFLLCGVRTVLMRTTKDETIHCVEHANGDKQQQASGVQDPFTCAVSEEAAVFETLESSHSCHPATEKLFLWRNGSLHWLKHIPVLGKGLVGFGPRFMFTLDVSVLLSKGLASNILYFTFLPMFLYRLNCGLELYQRLNVVGGIGWTMKPLIAVLSDVVAFCGFRRRWILTCFALIGGLLSICYSVLPAAKKFIVPTIAFYTGANYAMANIDVLTEGIYSRRIRESPIEGVFLVSSVFWMNMVGSLIGAFIQGPLSNAGNETIGGWIAGLCELALLPLFALNWLEEAPNREELHETSFQISEQEDDTDVLISSVEEKKTEKQCSPDLMVAPSFNYLGSDSSSSCDFFPNTANASSEDGDEEKYLVGLFFSEKHDNFPCDEVENVNKVYSSLPSSLLLPPTEKHVLTERKVKELRKKKPEELPFRRAPLFCSSSSDKESTKVSLVGEPEMHGSEKITPKHVEIFSLGTSFFSCSYPCVEVNYKTVSSQKRVVILCVGLTFGVVALAVLTMILGAYSLLLAIVIFSCIAMGLLFWALPPIIAKTGVFIFLHQALYIDINGLLNSFCLAGSQCVPGGPQFNFTTVYTVATVVSSVAGMLGITIFAYVFSHRSYRFSFFVLTILRAAASIFDLILVRRWNLLIHVPDLLVFLVGDAVIYQLVNRLSWMPVALLISQLCPRGSEAMMYALLAAMSNLGSSMATEVSVVLMGVVWPVDFSSNGEESCEFQNLWKLIVAGHIVMPLLVLPLIPICVPRKQIRKSFSP